MHASYVMPVPMLPARLPVRCHGCAMPKWFDTRDVRLGTPRISSANRAGVNDRFICSESCLAAQIVHHFPDFPLPLTHSRSEKE